MKKIILGITLALGLNTLVHATAYNLFSQVYCNNGSYSCNLPGGSLSGQEITSCTFTFKSLYSYQSGSLYCNLIGGDKTDYNVGVYNKSTQTWTCTLSGTELSYLNNCLSTGACNLGIECNGFWNIGDCSWDYTCTTTNNTSQVPDPATTALLLAFGFGGLELIRRKFVKAVKAI